MSGAERTKPSPAATGEPDPKPDGASLRARFRKSLSDAEARLLDPDTLDRTLEALVEEAAITPRLAASLRVSVREQFQGSRYILKQLSVHLAIGAVFAFDVVPLPLGTIARVAWVAGSRVVETLRRNFERARVHSIGVLLLAAVPWVGYAAYLIPLRRHGAELAFVLANQTWLARSGTSYETFLASSRAPLRRLGRWLIPYPSFDESIPATPGDRD